MLNLKKRGFYFLFSLSSLFLSCNLVIQVDTIFDNKQDKSEIVIKTKILTKEYTGWWIYGEGHHIFKDEESLEEWNLEFQNENMKELEELYISITNMEYFPMECKMIGEKETNVLTKEIKLLVSDFEILYIQGCEDE